MIEVNLFGNAKQHSCACAIDPKLSSDIEALLNIPTPRHYVFCPCPHGDGIRSDIFGISGTCRVGYKYADGKGRNTT